MATGGQEEISNEESVVVTGSETVFDHVCQPCSEETTKEAVGFCVDCAEWLCEECFRTHRRAKPARNHALKDTDEMKNSTSSRERLDKCTEKCDSHTGKKLKYYCPDHDSLGCSKCIIQNHRTCEIQHIPDVCKEVDIMNEFQQITAKLKVIAVEANEIVSDLNNKIELVKENKVEAIKSFRSYRKKLDESLDNIEVALDEQCEKREEEETTRLKHISEKCDTDGKESLILKTQLEVFEQNGKHCNMFVALKRSKSKLETMQSSIKQAKRSSRVKGYRFRPNVDVNTMINGSDGIGTLVERHIRRDDTDYSNIQVQYIADITVKTENNSTCHISGSVILPTNKLVLIDHTNSQVKVVDTNQNKMIADLKLGNKPWGVCKVSDNTVAVTIYNEQQISFVTILQSGKIYKSKDISVNGECQGIAVINDRMVVSYRKPNKMEIMDMNGSVLHTITTNERGEKIFNTPAFVIPSPDNESVYVSNLASNTVICMKSDGSGTVLHEYKDVLRGPEQVAVDSNGMCYVGCWTSSNVHLITPDCKKVRVVLGESDGMKNVNSVCYCKDSDRLYIGMSNCDIIKVFQLSF